MALVWVGIIALPNVVRIVRKLCLGNASDFWELSKGALMALALCGVLAELSRRYWNEVVYDDGDALVVKKGLRREIRIPFSSIQRVTFRPCRTENIHLKIDPPSKLGRTFIFNVQHEGTSEDHNPIADDLHRRSRCCKDSDDSV